MVKARDEKSFCVISCHRDRSAGARAVQEFSQRATELAPGCRGRVDSPCFTLGRTGNRLLIQNKHERIAEIGWSEGFQN